MDEKILLDEIGKMIAPIAERQMHMQAMIEDMGKQSWTRLRTTWRTSSSLSGRWKRSPSATATISKSFAP